MYTIVFKKTCRVLFCFSFLFTIVVIDECILVCLRILFSIFSLDLVTFFLFCFVTIKPSIFKLTFLIIRVCYQKR